MIDILIYLLIYSGSALMIYNIIRYIVFIRNVRHRDHWEKRRLVLYLPLILLTLFLLGYLAVGIFGEPDIIISSILFGGSFYVTLMQLLTEGIADRIRENERLEAMLEAAEEASTAKSFFLSNMSHDIRTPLNAIIGYTKLANNDATTLDEHRSYITKIESAGEQLLGIVNDVLEMSRIENGKLELVPENMDIVAAVDQAAELISAQMAAKHINFTSHSEVKAKWVMCDRSQLDRVLVNILGNACKFTPEGGNVSMTLEQTGEAEAERQYEIRIKDDGIGMSPEFAENIFKPFERERTSTVSRIQGTGLGMSIAKYIVDLMGGNIAVKTDKGCGTEFIINLSLPIGEEEKPDCDSMENYDFSGHRLLLAEDNEINREIAVMLLEQHGFEVETAEDGQVALDKVAASSPGYYTVVLMDIQMPVMDGYQATRAIRGLEDERLAQIPIIAMTANAFREDEIMAIEAGMQGHIAKPLNVDAMLKTLCHVIFNSPDRTGMPK